MRKQNRLHAETHRDLLNYRMRKAVSQRMLYLVENDAIKLERVWCVSWAPIRFINKRIK